MKKQITKGRVTVAMALMASFVAPMAMAAGEAEAALDSILAEANAMIAKGWLIAVPVVLFFIGVKLFKKVGNKST